MGTPRRLPPSRVALALAGAVTLAGLGYAFAHSGGGGSSHVARPSATSAARPEPTTTPIAVIDVVAGTITPPRQHLGDTVTSASDALQRGVPGLARQPDGSLIWTLGYTNVSGLPIRLSGPVHLHVAAALHAGISSVRLLDGRSPVTPDTNIGMNHTVRLLVRLRVDCGRVDQATTPFPVVPIEVVISLFGYAGSDVAVLTTPSDPPWQQVCRAS